MTNHQMSLTENSFRQIKNGTKTLEIRLFDEKRKILEIGDLITFSCNDEEITIEILGLSKFAHFIDLFNALGGISAGWSAKDTPNQMAQDLRKYYTQEEEKKFGVLGIHIKTIARK